MEEFANFFCSNAHYAHYLFFGMILLTGLNIPLPEDILVMLAGMLVATCVPEHYWLMFGWVLAGALLSAYEAYWIGRYLGPRLYGLRFFRHVITPERVNKIGHFLERFGVLTFIVGRFIPFGFRNCIFMTCGLWKMSFPRFMLRDGVGAFIATCALFSLGHQFGANYRVLLHYFHTYELIVLSAIVMIFISVGLFIWYKRSACNHNGSL